MNQPTNLGEAQALISELQSQNAKLESELKDTREQIIAVGQKLLPIFKMLELDKMFKPGAKPNVFMIILKASRKLLKHWEQLQALIERDEHFLSQIINLFLVKYGPDIQARRISNIEQWQKPGQRALGSGSSSGSKAIG